MIDNKIPQYLLDFFNNTIVKVYTQEDLNKWFSNEVKYRVVCRSDMCIVKNVKSHFGFFDYELIGDTKEPIDIYLYKQSNTGIELFPTVGLGFYVNELKDIPFIEMSLKEFMKDRFAYNHRLLANMTEFFHWYQGDNHASD